MSDPRRWGETWEQCARRLHGGNEELEAALRYAVTQVPELMEVPGIANALFPPDSELAEGAQDDLPVSGEEFLRRYPQLASTKTADDERTAQRQDAMLERREALLKNLQDADAVAYGLWQSGNPMSRSCAYVIRQAIQTAYNELSALSRTSDEGGVPEAVNVVFDGPPGPNPPHFVEVETDDGRSVRVGEWIERDDGMWALRIDRAIAQSEQGEVRLTYVLETDDWDPVQELIEDKALNGGTGDELRVFLRAVNGDAPMWRVEYWENKPARGRK